MEKIEVDGEWLVAIEVLLNGKVLEYNWILEGNEANNSEEVLKKSFNTLKTMYTICELTPDMITSARVFRMESVLKKRINTTKEIKEYF